MEHMWNEIDRRNQKYSGKKIYPSVHLKFHMDRTGIEPGPLSWEAGD